ncbi:MAG: YceH family protein [Candidatus Kapabacteria bacterium]|jgi:hypothetical protein|nr:YceH family protein [Candidatus Kapabacteria bacterium]
MDNTAINTTPPTDQTGAFLSPQEARVLGSLVEKEITTPDYYPMTLNALTAACNQKSNRDPVLQMSETDVAQAFDEARKKALCRVVEAGASRVPKYRQRMTETFQLTAPQTAILCELLLRGAQTLGELRSRAERIHSFSSLTEVESVLAELSSSEHPAAAIAGTPLVTRLPRQTGQKEARFTHLLCGAVNLTEASQNLAFAPNSDADRIVALEQEISSLRQELAALREEFQTFKRQLE